MVKHEINRIPSLFCSKTSEVSQHIHHVKGNILCQPVRPYSPALPLSPLPGGLSVLQPPRPSHCSLRAPGLSPASPLPGASTSCRCVPPPWGLCLNITYLHTHCTSNCELSHPGTPSTPQDPLPQLSSSPEPHNLRYQIFYVFVIVSPSYQKSVPRGQGFLFFSFTPLSPGPWTVSGP